MQTAVVPARVAARREELGLTQDQLARLCGTTQQSINRLEHDKIRRPRYLLELAEALQVSPAWLLGETDDKTQEPARQRALRALGRIKGQDLPLAAQLLERLAAGDPAPEDAG